MKSFFLTLMAVVALAGHAVSAELPAKPAHYFNDYAGIISPAVASELDAKLTQLDKDTTTQYVVAVFPTFPSDTSVEDFTQRTAEAWGVGHKKTDNGVVLFIFVKDNNGKTTTRLEVGYGLEGVLPDATAKQIVDTQIRPHIREAKAGKGQPEWDAAVKGGVNSVIAVVHGEYKAAAVSTATPLTGGQIFLIIVVGIIIFIVLCALLGGMSGSGGGYSSSGSWGGSSGSSDSGGFSGGGGSFGGGGASGSD